LQMQGPYIFIKKSNHGQRRHPLHIILLWTLRQLCGTVACLLSTTGPVCSYNLEERVACVCSEILWCSVSMQQTFQHN
jgi:hypothetical protein